MEKRKNNLILIIVFILIVVIICFTIYKIDKNHKDNLYNVMYSRIEYNAKKCYLDDVCKDKITLQYLYDNKYLDIQYDPITKEELDKNMEISYKNEKIIIKK